MGTINYKTGDVITLGFDVSGDVEEDYGIEEVEMMREYIEAKAEDIDHDWFNLDIDSGYYEGFYVAVNRSYNTDNELDRDISNGILLESIADMWRLTDEMKEEVKVEAEELRKELKTLITESFVVCFPSWCTGYCDKVASMTEIDKAIDKVISEL
jgi:hypothetical protein